MSQDGASRRMGDLQRDHAKRQAIGRERQMCIECERQVGVLLDGTAMPHRPSYWGDGDKPAADRKFRDRSRWCSGSNRPVHRGSARVKNPPPSSAAA